MGTCIIERSSGDFTTSSRAEAHHVGTSLMTMGYTADCDSGLSKVNFHCICPVCTILEYKYLWWSGRLENSGYADRLLGSRRA